MRYALIVALAALIGFATADPVAAQDRSGSILDRIFSTVVDGDDDREPRVIIGERDGRTQRGDDRGRGRTGDDRGRTDDDVDRRRGRTGGDVEGPRGRTGRRDGGVYEPGRRSDDDADDRRRGDDGWEDDDDYRGRRGENGKRGGGPAFCRSGEGHPVFGRKWCREKGFGQSNDDYWESRRARDVYFPSPERRNNDSMGGGILEDILGDVVLGRLSSHARNLRADGPIRGLWNGDSELRIFAGGNPLARFVDLDADSRADVVYLRK